MKYIFAYGTLRERETQLRALGRPVLDSSPAITKGRVFYRNINDQQCRFLDTSVMGSTEGLLLPVDERELQAIDTYEGHAYQRMEIDVFNHKGEPHPLTRKAFAYLENRSRETGRKPEHRTTISQRYHDWLKK